MVDATAEPRNDINQNSTRLAASLDLRRACIMLLSRARQFLSANRRTIAFFFSLMRVRFHVASWPSMPGQTIFLSNFPPYSVWQNVADGFRPADQFIDVPGSAVAHVTSVIPWRVAERECGMTDREFTGSCLCGRVRFTVRGEPQRFFHCHCSRCRKASGTGHASNLFVAGTLTWDAGEALVRRFKVPEAERFTNAFCTECGARMPRFQSQAGIVMIPAGSLDGDPGMAPQARIFAGSRAGWSCAGDALPAFDEYAG